MTAMTADGYVNERLDPEISWYDRKSTTHKNAYIAGKVIEIVCAAIIPFLAGYAAADPKIPLVIGTLGMVVATLSGVAALLKFHEHWIKYRTTAESLKKEKILFQTRVDPYNVPEPLPVLVQRAEALISQENTSWAQIMSKPPKDDGGKRTNGGQ
jgi:hypothetical protein